jgi:hypothetical protein
MTGEQLFANQGCGAVKSRRGARSGPPHNWNHQQVLRGLTAKRLTRKVGTKKVRIFRFYFDRLSIRVTVFTRRNGAGRNNPDCVSPAVFLSQASDRQACVELRWF